MYPLKFEPLLKKKIWGGDKIVPFKKLDSDLKDVGESWEISCVEKNESIVINGIEKGLKLSELVKKYKGKLLGESNYEMYGDNFPLLVKFIDANHDLSVQVHPNDAMAQKLHASCGKTEMWYVISAQKGSKIYSGFTKKLTTEEFDSYVASNSIQNVLRKCEVKAGDVFYLPAGQVHCIGAGTFIVEIQQTSDVTYRIFDYARTDEDGHCRELHLDLAKQAIDFNSTSDYHLRYDTKLNEPTGLVSCPYFTTSLYNMTEDIVCDYSELDSFVIFTFLEGSCTIRDNELNELVCHAGETILIPACVKDILISPSKEGVKLLEVYV